MTIAETVEQPAPRAWICDRCSNVNDTGVTPALWWPCIVGRSPRARDAAAQRLDQALNRARLRAAVEEQARRDAAAWKRRAA